MGGKKKKKKKKKGKKEKSSFKKKKKKSHYQDQNLKNEWMGATQEKVREEHYKQADRGLFLLYRCSNQ